MPTDTLTAGVPDENAMALLFPLAFNGRGLALYRLVAALNEAAAGERTDKVADELNARARAEKAGGA